MSKPILNKLDVVYLARIYPKLDIYDLCELTVRTIDEAYFVAIEKSTKKAFLLPYCDIGKTVFYKRKDALQKVREAEANREEASTETYYEEY